MLRHTTIATKGIEKSTFTIPEQIPSKERRPKRLVRNGMVLVLGMLICLTLISHFVLLSFTEDLVPPTCGRKEPLTWIMFMGDSNMRNTYNWWTSTKIHQPKRLEFSKSSTYGIDKHNDFGRRWADQEYLVKRNINDTNMSTVRYSFRFLHGNVAEFVNDSNDWNIARVGAIFPKPEQMAEFLQTEDTETLWKGANRPSDFALWATKNQQPINETSKKFMTFMKNWDKKNDPDVVILTQGWGGVPRSHELDSVRMVVKNNPHTLFIWSPLYVTDNTPERYETYVESKIYNWTEPNLRMVDLWDLAKKLPLSSGQHGVHHIGIGGAHMKKSMERIWNEVVACLF